VRTERLYYSDSYLKKFEARLIGRSGDGMRIYLDRTAFYPESGGQPSDRGWCNGIRVLDVIDEADAVAHVLEAPLADDTVHCEVDWPRRLEYMQQHTGQHLLSAVLLEHFGIRTLSFHMGQETSTIELDCQELTTTQAAAAETRVAGIVQEAKPVSVTFESAEAAGDLRKPSERTGTLRIVSIDGVDRSACGGTHVRSTSEIGPLLIRAQDKVRGHARIEFLCGSRALQRARKDFQLLQQLGKFCSVAIDDLPRNLEAIKARLVECGKQLEQSRLEIAALEGRRLWECAATSGDGVRRAALTVDEISEAERATAQAFVASGGAAILFIARKRPALLLAVSSDTPLHAGNLLKAALQKAGGKGGGSAAIAQGTVGELAIAIDLARELGFDPNSPVASGAS
jgi:alanyl-tRNA synthetase